MINLKRQHKNTIKYVFLFAILLVLVYGILGIMFAALANDVRAYLAFFTSVVLWNQFEDIIKKVL